MNALTHSWKHEKHTENSFKVDKERKFLNYEKVVVHFFSCALKKREKYTSRANMDYYLSSTQFMAPEVVISFSYQFTFATIFALCD